MKYLEENEEYVENLTIAEKIKFITAYEWAGDNKPTPEQAVAKAKDKCAKEKIENRRMEGNLSFESELSSIEAIKKIAILSNEEAAILEQEIFTKKEISPELSEKIRNAFNEQGVEEKVIECLGIIHDNWVKNHSDNFQKIVKAKDGTEKKRDKDYQFVDLRLMTYNKDGASADLIFIQPILEACGIQIDKKNLEEALKKAQEKFLKDKNIETEKDLLEYIKGGSKKYSALEGLKAYDGNFIDDHLNGETKVEERAETGEFETITVRIAKRVVKNLKENGIELKKMHKAKEFAGFGKTGTKLEKKIYEEKTESDINKDSKKRE